MVREERLELSHLAAPEPKSGVSTNFTIPASKCTKIVYSTALDFSLINHFNRVKYGSNGGT